MSKQLSLLSEPENVRHLTKLPPQHTEETEISGNQLREGDLVLVKKRGAEKQLRISRTDGGLYLIWPLCGEVRFYKNTCFGPNGWRIVRVLARAPEKK